MLYQYKTTHLRYEALFGFFPAHIRSQLMNECKARTCPAGSLIFKLGEAGDWMGAILAGRVRISLQSIEGKDMFLSMFERGEIFGERALLDGLPRGADAYAEEETTFLVIPKERIMPLLFQYPEAMFCIVQILCNRLLRYTETMQLYALGNLPCRIANCLLSLAHTYSEQVDGKTIIRAGLSQSDIAQKTASTRESVNRQLKTFASQGLIELKNDSIIILDQAGLQKICDAPPQN